MTTALPRPERSDLRRAALRKRARRALVAAGIDVGGDHLIEPIVEAITVELEALRERSAGLLLQLHERGDRILRDDGSADDDSMERLAYAVANHYLDEHGDIQIAFPDDAPGDA